MASASIYQKTLTKRCMLRSICFNRLNSMAVKTGRNLYFTRTPKGRVIMTWHYKPRPAEVPMDSRIDHEKEYRAARFKMCRRAGYTALGAWHAVNNYRQPMNAGYVHYYGKQSCGAYAAGHDDTVEFCIHKRVFTVDDYQGMSDRRTTGYEGRYWDC